MSGKGKQHGKFQGKGKRPFVEKKEKITEDGKLDHMNVNENEEEAQGNAFLPLDEMTFDDLIGEQPNSTEILQGVYSTGKSNPSRIQCQVIPHLLQDPPQSVMAQAETGSGKTLSFNIPMYFRVNQELKELQAICMCPTRELVNQAYNDFMAISQYKQVLVGRALKDMEVKRDVQVLFGTPATIRQVVSPRRDEENQQQNEDRISLKHVKILVIDEADAIVEKDSSHISAAKYIIHNIPKDAQFACFSATYPRDDKKYLKSQGFDMTEFTIPRVEQLKEIKHFICKCGKDQVKENLLKILKSISCQQFYVFVAKKEDTNEYSEMLSKAGYTAGTLTAAMLPEERDATVEKFRNGELKALVTVNAFSRGLDIPDASHVFSVDLPVPLVMKRRDPKTGKEYRRIFTDIDSYVHRCGRAGRFGRGGVSFTFVKDERDFRTICSISRQTQIEFHEINPDELKDIALDEAGQEQGNVVEAANVPENTDNGEQQQQAEEENQQAEEAKNEQPEETTN